MVEVAELSLAFTIISLFSKGYLCCSLYSDQEHSKILRLDFGHQTGWPICRRELDLVAWAGSVPVKPASHRNSEFLGANVPCLDPAKRLCHAIRWNQDLSQDLTAMVKEVVAQIRQIWVFRSSSWGVCLQLRLRCQGRKSPSLPKLKTEREREKLSIGLKNAGTWSK